MSIETINTFITDADLEAFESVMRTNKRRNLTSSRWTTIAVQAKELVQTIKDQIEKRSSG